MPEPDRKSGSDLMQLADLGLRLALTTALFAFLGYKLDQWLDTAPILLIVLTFVGLTGGMIMVVRGVNSWQRRQPGETSAEPEPPASDRPSSDRPSSDREEP